MFKKLSLAAASLFAASSAKAGTLTEPTVEQVVETAEAANSSGFLIPLLILGAVAAVVASSDSDEDSSPSIY